MKVQKRAGRLVVLAISAVLVFTGAAWPLNPLVTRSERPGVAPADCEESLAPAPAPRVDVAQIPPREIVPASIPAPPSRSLRSELEAAQVALDRNDRPSFDAHFATARDILRDYPPGAERSAAEEAVRAFDDASRIWDAQFESPFFDQNSDAYARANRYPGYENAVRRSVFTDDADRRFYPAAESRDFIARAAAERLTRLGIRTPTQRARVDRTERPPTASPSISRSTPPRATTATDAAPRRITRPKQASTSPARRSTPPRRKSTNVPSPSSLAKSGKSVAPAAVASASPDPPTSANSATEPAPAAPTATAPTPVAEASPVAEGSSTTPVPTDTISTAPTTTTAAPETSATATTATTTEPEATATERRPLIVPALLILIGLGVLWVLFRAAR